MDAEKTRKWPLDFNQWGSLTRSLWGTATFLTFSQRCRASSILQPSDNDTVIKHFMLNQTCSSECFTLRILIKKERSDDFMYLYLAPSASDLYPHLASLNIMTASNYLPGCCFAHWQTLWYWLIFALWVSVALLWHFARLSFHITFLCPWPVSVEDSNCH